MPSVFGVSPVRLKETIGRMGPYISEDIKSRKEHYFLSEEDRRKWLDDMFRSLATQGREETLASEEALTREGASEATMGAARRGIGTRTKQVEAQAETAIEQFSATFNQMGQRYLDQFNLALKGMEQEKELGEQANWMTLLSNMGMAAGYFFPLPK